MPTLARLASLPVLLVGLFLANLDATPTPLAAAEPHEPTETSAAETAPVETVPAKPGVTGSGELEQFFENEVRPLLAKHCFKCHGAEKQQAGLRLDSRGALLLGGDSGPALVPGKAAESLLLEAVRYESLEMPPDQQLGAAQVAVLSRWIDAGAPWPGDDDAGPLKRVEGLTISQQDRQFWSFRPLQREPLPDTPGDWPVNNPIDVLVQARLHAAGLVPAPVAEPRELVRRLYVDLVGLPPDRDEIDRVVDDPSPLAIESLVDRLLNRPQYGERWARHWLDVVRFAQTNGYERDDEKPLAWRYRDYVIRAWNADKPYDRFLTEQLAGDQLEVATDDSLTATAFYRLGVWDDEPDDRRQAEFDNLDDVLATVSTSMLGLTVGCARCHDHKFDPIPQEDYYRLLAFVRNIKPYVNPGDKQADGTIFARLSDGEKTLAVSQRPGDPEPTHVLIRGSAANPGKQVQPGFPQVLCPAPSSESASEPETSTAGESVSAQKSGRLALAAWVASPDNPLTARVLVNRLWHYHFGQGLVSTPSDFGRTGSLPSHPELLDFLASELIRQNWQIKPIQRLIVTSHTYRQSSRVQNASATQSDPDNRLLWRQNLRRLEAESIRDAILSVSGQLNLQMGGRGVFPLLNPEVLATQSRPGAGWDKSSEAERCRRSVYVFVKRTLRVPLLETLDAASPDTVVASRNTTTIAPQALILLNSQFTQQQSEAMAERVVRDVGLDARRQVERGFELALGREPTATELRVCLDVLERQTEQLRALAASGSPVVEEPSTAAPAGWTLLAGRWTLRADGGLEVAPHPGAKAIWQRDELTDGTVTAQVLLGRPGGDAGILLRVADAREGVDALHGYNINFLAGRVRLGKHQNNWRALAEAPCNLEFNAWQDVRIEMQGAKIRVFVGQDAEPVLDFEDPQPLPAGRLGFRTFQAAAAIRNVRWTSGERQGTLEMEPASDPMPSPLDPARRLALAAVCKLILNLNEFIYID